MAGPVALRPLQEASGQENPGLWRGSDEGAGFGASGTTKVILEAVTAENQLVHWYSNKFIIF